MSTTKCCLNIFKWSHAKQVYSGNKIGVCHDKGSFFPYLKCHLGLTRPVSKQGKTGLKHLRMAHWRRPNGASPQMSYHPANLDKEGKAIVSHLLCLSHTFVVLSSGYLINPKILDQWKLQNRKLHLLCYKKTWLELWMCPLSGGY